MVRLAAALCALAIGAAVPASAGALSPADQYNVFTLGNFTDSYSDVQGALAAQGVVTITGFQVAGSFSASSTFFTLVAGGDLMAGNGSANGRVYDGTPGGIGQSFTIAPGDLVSGGTDPIDFADAGAQLRSTASSLAAMATTAGDSCSPNYYYLSCTATQHGLNIINIPAQYVSYFGNGHAPMITSTYSDATVVLNVTGASLTNGGWSINGINSQQVLVNFADATSVTFNGSVPVSILAPNAAVTAPSGGAMNGTLIAGSFSSGQYQFNNYPFTGTLPNMGVASATPEPSTLVLPGAGLLLFAAAHWRNRRR